MKKRLVLALAAALVPAAAYAMCPITMLFFSYGAACSPSSQQTPSLSGQMDTLVTCGVRVDFTVPPQCCNVIVASQWFVIGSQQLTPPQPGFCSLLATPDIVLPLPPTVGTTQLSGAMPMDTGLIGTSFYMQGIVQRFTTIGQTSEFEFTNGLEMRITP